MEDTTNYQGKFDVSALGKTRTEACVKGINDYHLLNSGPETNERPNGEGAFVED